MTKRNGAGLCSLFLLTLICALYTPACAAEQDIPTPPKADPAADLPRELHAADIAEEIDVTADKPEAEAEKVKKAPLLEVLAGEDPLNAKARQCYAVLADIKTNVDLIAKDLDDHGKEITRLSRTSEALTKNINELVDIWPGNELFRDTCGLAKLQTLVLNEELERVPRTWTHVRWAFNSTVKELRKTRLYAKELADAEPKPIAVKGKDGKISYAEPEGPVLSEAEQKKQMMMKEAAEVKARARDAKEKQKNRKLQTELDKPEDDVDGRPRRGKLNGQGD
jgi:hypothetical protein